MARFRSKPVVIEAVKYTGTKQSFDEIWEFMGGHEKDGGYNQGYEGSENNPGEFGILTREGVMKATPGDWIVKSVNGEFYPCKPGIFRASFEDV